MEAGLDATGNTSAALTADECAGPGATGPSIVFGYIAARHAERCVDTDLLAAVQRRSDVVGDAMQGAG